MVQLDFNLRKLACEIVHGLRKQENIHCVLTYTLEVDDVLIAHGQYKHSLQA